MKDLLKRTYIEEYADFLFDSFPGLRTKIAQLPQNVTPKDTKVRELQAECKAFVKTKRAQKRIRMTPGSWNIATLRHWASSKHVYDVHPNLMSELDVSMKDEISAEALRNLPYPAIYVRCPKRETVEEKAVPGACVTMDVMQEGFLATMHGNVLQILFCSRVLSYTINGQSFQGNLPTSECPITTWGDAFDLDKIAKVSDLFDNEIVGEGGYQALDQDNKFVVELAKRLNRKKDRSFGKNGEVEDLRKAIAALLYISSKNADIKAVNASRNTGKKKKGKTPKRYGETSANVMQVGYRIGAALGAARVWFEQENADEKRVALTGRKIAPHVRRAHWHAYWTGPRANPTGIVVHWIPPVFVNADGSENTITTIHQAS